MDFTIVQYKKLLKILLVKGYSFQTMEEFMTKPKDRVVILRHDVDSWPENALELARAEFQEGIKATYYFRIIRTSNNPEIIRKIVKMGHEIGYHYEDLAASNGNLESAISSFLQNLNYFRQYYPVKTICMHGSSMSEFDNRDMWKHFNFNDYEIIGEPYLSIDYSNILYLTDTGRCWDGDKYNVRDFVSNDFKFSFHKTNDIIEALKKDKLPQKIVIQSHTLWTDNKFIWFRLFLRTKLRNNFKVFFFKRLHVYFSYLSFTR